MPPPTVSGRKISAATAAIVCARAWRLSIVAVTSRMTTSSMPSTLYRLASAAGSPASRRPSKLTPLTTLPSRTSRHAMMRLDSIRLRSFGAVAQQVVPVTQDLQPDVTGLLGMELHRRHPIALDRGAERHTVLADRRRVIRHWRRIGMGEIGLCSASDAGHQP